MLTWLNPLSMVLGVVYRDGGFGGGSGGLEASLFLHFGREPSGQRRGLAAVDHDGAPQGTAGLPGPTEGRSGLSRRGALPCGPGRLELGRPHWAGATWSHRGRSVGGGAAERSVADRGAPVVVLGHLVSHLGTTRWSGERRRHGAVHCRRVHGHLNSLRVAS